MRQGGRIWPACAVASVTSRRVSRSAVWGLYALLVVIWSSTWVSIKIGLEDCPPLLGAGIRFAFAGLVLLAVDRARRAARCAPTSGSPPCSRLFPFALTYGLVYWGEQYIPSGLAAVLFGVLPLYVALLGAAFLPDQPLRQSRDRWACWSRSAAWRSRSSRASTSATRTSRSPGPRRSRSPRSGAAVGNISIKLRAGRARPVVLNGWAMLGGRRRRCWRCRRWARPGARPPGRAKSLGSIAYLALIGSAVPFVGADGAAAPHHRAGDVVPGDAAAVRRARSSARPSTTSRSPPARSAAPRWSRPAC